MVMLGGLESWPSTLPSKSPQVHLGLCRTQLKNPRKPGLPEGYLRCPSRDGRAGVGPRPSDSFPMLLLAWADFPKPWLGLLV